MLALYFQIIPISRIWNPWDSLGLRHGNLLGGGTVKHESGWMHNIMLRVCFSSAHIYLFGMMKGRSTLIIKTNMINTEAACANTAAAPWWMSCKRCQHLFLMMVCDTQPPWSSKSSDTLVHISPITMVYGGVLVTFPLSLSLLWLLPCLLIHS